MRERSQFREPDGRGGAGQGTVEDDVDSTTETGTEGGGPRDEAGGGSREGGIGGRAGEGRTIPGRKRITARGAVGGSEEGRGGEKKAANEANLEMIKQLMAQRFSDMPAARGARERSQSPRVVALVRVGNVTGRWRANRRGEWREEPRRERN